jgi:hypothetical protein
MKRDRMELLTMALLRDYPDYPLSGPQSFAAKIKEIGGSADELIFQRSNTR